MATTKFYLDRRSGDALFPLKLTITHERKAVHLLLNIRLAPEQWDGVKVVKHPRAAMLNNQLLARKTEIDCKLYEWGKAGKLRGIEVKKIKELLEQEEGGKKDVITFGAHYREYMKRKKGNTLVGYKHTLDTLLKYCDIDRVAFEEITARELTE